jgi:hypothetical protein
MQPIIVATVDGYSTSSAMYDLETTTRCVLDVNQVDFSLVGVRSRLVVPTWRKVIRHLKHERAASPTVLLVGKSLGAKIILNKVVLRALDMYEHVYVFTIDPCWPRWGVEPTRHGLQVPRVDWTPNRNGDVLVVPAGVTEAVNVYVESADASQQCGCPVARDRKGKGVVRNMAFSASHGYDHWNVVGSKAVKSELGKLAVRAARRERLSSPHELR